MRSRVLLWLPLFACVAAVAFADGKGVQPSETPTETGVIDEDTRARLEDIYGDNLLKTDPDGRPIHPMMAEIGGLLEAESQQMVELQARFESARSQDEAQLVQTLMAELKQGTETRILQVQLRYAKSTGNLQLARELESALQFKENPVVPTQKVDRPAPRDHDPRR